MIGKDNSDFFSESSACDHGSYPYSLPYDAKNPAAHNHEICVPSDYSVDSAGKPFLEKTDLLSGSFSERHADDVPSHAELNCTCSSKDQRNKYPTKYVYDTDKKIIDTNSLKCFPKKCSNKSTTPSVNSTSEKFFSKPILELAPIKNLPASSPKIKTIDDKVPIKSLRDNKLIQFPRNNISKIASNQKAKAAAEVKDKIAKKISNPSSKQISLSTDESSESVVEESTTDGTSSMTKTTTTASSKTSVTSVSDTATGVQSSRTSLSTADSTDSSESDDSSTSSS